MADNDKICIWMHNGYTWETECGESAGNRDLYELCPFCGRIIAVEIEDDEPETDVGMEVAYA